MAKYLSSVSGVVTEVQPVNTSAGAGDAAKVPELDATGRIDNSMMPVGIGADTKDLEASEILAAGDIINVWDNTTAMARKADATAAGKECVGFVLAGYAAAATATVYFEGTITGLTGLTIGATYYMDSAVPGGLVSTPPAGSGVIVQRVGVAISATELSFEPGDPITLV